MPSYALRSTSPCFSGRWAMTTVPTENRSPSPSPYSRQACSFSVIPLLASETPSGCQNTCAFVGKWELTVSKSGKSWVSRCERLFESGGRHGHTPHLPRGRGEIAWNSSACDRREGMLETRAGSRGCTRERSRFGVERVRLLGRCLLPTFPSRLRSVWRR